MAEWRQRREPFSHIDEWTTELGTHIEVGETYLVKPTYVDARLPAVADAVYWDPDGLPGGDADHRGELVEVTDEGEYVYERPDDFDCILNVVFHFDIDEDDEYAHLDGKRRKVEAYNLDFVVGTGREILRDRSNCRVADFPEALNDG